MKKFAFIIGFLAFLSANPASAAEPSAINVYGKCTHGLKHQPNGPFAVIVFCEDAMSTYIGVLCYAAGTCEKAEYADGKTRFEAWEFYNRMWQEEDWVTDVTSFAWSPDQKSLFVATGKIYGSGGLYQLDLERRKVKQLLPADQTVSGSNPGDGYFITGISKDGKSLSYEVQQINNTEPKPTPLKLSIPSAN